MLCDFSSNPAKSFWVGCPPRVEFTLLHSDIIHLLPRNLHGNAHWISWTDYDPAQNDRDLEAIY
jgi:hypothetical protein